MPEVGSISWLAVIDTTQLNNSVNQAINILRRFEQAESKIGGTSQKTAKDFDYLSKEVKEVKQDLKNLTSVSKSAEKGLGALGSKAKKTGSSLNFAENLDFSKLTGSIGQIAVRFGILGTAITGTSAIISEMIEVNKNFEYSLSTLQSILGISKEELKFFSEEAKRLGATTTQSAVDVVEAFKLIGSQKPELLSDREALVSVTESAITLAEASGLTVPESAKALTTALNQMGASADETARYINVLASGSQKGSADIPYLATAIEKVGAVAKASNLSIEQLVGALETLAPSFSEPSSAGLALKNVLLNLQTAGYGMSSGTFDMVEALTQVKQEYENILNPAEKAQFLTKLFGKENIIAGQVLMNNLETYKNFTEAVTGTNTAFEQAKINTDNLDGALKRLQSAWESLLLSAGEGISINKILTKAVDFIADFISGLGGIKDVISAILEPIKNIFSYLSEIPKILGLSNKKLSLGKALANFIILNFKRLTFTLRIALKILAFIIKILVNLIKKTVEWAKSNKVVMGIIKAIKGFFKTFIDWIKKQLQNVVNFINKIITKLGFKPIKLNFEAETEINAKAKVDEEQVRADIENDVKNVNIPPIDKDIEIKAKPKIDWAELEKLRIQATLSGMQLELAQLELEFKQKLEKYKDNQEAINYLTQIYEKKRQEIINKYAQQEKELEKERQEFLLKFVKDSLDKRLQVVDMKYQQLIDKANQLGVSTVEIEKRWAEERKKVAEQWAEEQYQKSLENLKNQQNLEILRQQVAGASEEQLTILKKQYELERLNFALENQKNLTEFEKEQILLRRQLLENEIRTLQAQSSTITAFWKALGSEIQKINAESIQDVKDFGKALANAVREAIKIYLAETIALVIRNAFASMPNPAVATTLAILGATTVKLIFDKLVPKFQEGGIVGGDYYSGDKIIARLNSGELILTQRQAVNVLYHIAQQKPKNFVNENLQMIKKLDKIKKRLDEQNKLLKEGKRLIPAGNRLLVVDRFGRLTGDVIFIENQ